MESCIASEDEDPEPGATDSETFTDSPAVTTANAACELNACPADGEKISIIVPKDPQDPAIAEKIAIAVDEDCESESSVRVSTPRPTEPLTRYVPLTQLSHRYFPSFSPPLTPHTSHTPHTQHSERCDTPHSASYADIPRFFFPGERNCAFNRNTPAASPSLSVRRSHTLSHTPRTPRTPLTQHTQNSYTSPTSHTPLTQHTQHTQNSQPATLSQHTQDTTHTPLTQPMTPTQDTQAQDTHHTPPSHNHHTHLSLSLSSLCASHSDTDDDSEEDEEQQRESETTTDRALYALQRYFSLFPHAHCPVERMRCVTRTHCGLPGFVNALLCERVMDWYDLFVRENSSECVCGSVCDNVCDVCVGRDCERELCGCDCGDKKERAMSVSDCDVSLCGTAESKTHTETERERKAEDPGTRVPGVSWRAFRLFFSREIAPFRADERLFRLLRPLPLSLSPSPLSHHTITTHTPYTPTHSGSSSSHLAHTTGQGREEEENRLFAGLVSGSEDEREQHGESLSQCHTDTHTDSHTDTHTDGHTEMESVALSDCGGAVLTESPTEGLALSARLTAEDLVPAIQHFVTMALPRLAQQCVPFSLCQSQALITKFLVTIITQLFHTFDTQRCGSLSLRDTRQGRLCSGLCRVERNYELICKEENELMNSTTESLEESESGNVLIECCERKDECVVRTDIVQQEIQQETRVVECFSVSRFLTMKTAFRELNTDCNDVLQRKDLMRFERGVLSEEMVDRIFTVGERAMSDGELGFSPFHSHSAKDDPTDLSHGMNYADFLFFHASFRGFSTNVRCVLRYWLRCLDLSVCTPNAHTQLSLTREDALKWYVLQAKRCHVSSDCGDGGAFWEHLLSEVGLSRNTERVSLSELVSGQAGHFLEILVNSRAFAEYHKKFSA